MLHLVYEGMEFLGARFRYSATNLAAEAQGSRDAADVLMTVAALPSGLPFCFVLVHDKFALHGCT